MNKIIRISALFCAWICLVLGFVGVFIPLLPTTPFILLASVLFARFSPRVHTWLTSTKVYKHYVLPFREAGGLSLARKIKMLLISLAAIGASAYFVDHLYSRIALAAMALLIIYFIGFRVPTLKKEHIPS